MSETIQAQQSAAEETLHLLVLSYEDTVEQGDSTEEQLALIWEGVELYAESVGLTPYRLS
ncbi:MAG: hypothetical protein AAF583_07485 [Pseudomonadota bacterium]